MMRQVPAKEGRPSGGNIAQFPLINRWLKRPKEQWSIEEIVSVLQKGCLVGHPTLRRMDASIGDSIVGIKGHLYGQRQLAKRHSPEQ